jgi:predicted N-acyltransferase
VKLRVHQSIDEIPADRWNLLAGGNPFLRHEFLAALEHSGSVGGTSGWQPAHLSGSDVQGRLLAAMPLYIKSHSYGEYVFDWAWADAYQRAGLAYYPKLLSAVPFSPVTGPRLLMAADSDPHVLSKNLLGQAQALAGELGASSIHGLFMPETELPYWGEGGYLQRRDFQFHWHNRGYADFDAFLETFTADKRKKVRRERRRIAESGIRFEIRSGHELDDALLEMLFHFYTTTYAKRLRPAYLKREFFREIRGSLADALLCIIAVHQGQPVAAAICYRDADTLYGRHWGCSEEFHSLHFETCYYQGIDYCIVHGLQHFNPGTQGEHKISRGFEPLLTHSAHWVAREDFRVAIDEFLRREQHLVSAYLRETREHLPFNQQASDQH